MILIKDKEMPKICAYCFLDESECNLHKSVNIWKEKHPDCPLIEVEAEEQEEIIMSLNMIGGYLRKVTK